VPQSDHEARVAVRLARRGRLNCGDTLAWLITSIVSAAAFAGVKVAEYSLLLNQERIPVTGAAITTALVLVPL
jgi:heme/copper-type cytochrome/quinol oxidase subunit 3